MQVGLSDLTKHLHSKMEWFHEYTKEKPLESFKATVISPKMSPAEAAQHALNALRNTQGLILMRQSHYRNTKGTPIPQTIKGYSRWHEKHPLIFINATHNLDEQTQLLFIGVIRILLAADGFYSSIFDSSIKESYAESVYYELRNLVGSEEFLEPVREDDLFYEREDALGEPFFKAVRNAIYSGKLSNRSAADLMDISERKLIGIFP